MRSSGIVVTGISSIRPSGSCHSYGSIGLKPSRHEPNSRSRLARSSGVSLAVMK